MPVERAVIYSANGSGVVMRALKIRLRNYRAAGKANTMRDVSYECDYEMDHILALNEHDQPVGCLSLHTAEQSELVRLGVLKNTGNVKFCEASRFAMDEGYRDLKSVRYMFNAVWDWVIAHNLEVMFICVTPELAPLYEKVLGFKQLPDSEFNHPKYAGREHVVMYLESPHYVPEQMPRT